MALADLLTPQRISLDVRLHSRKRMLERLAAQLADADGVALDQRALFEALCERERLGSTALGHGVAIPHARVDGLDDSLASILRLSKPLDYDTPDGQPVDLIVGLVVPQACTDSHLRILSELAGCLQEEDFRAGVRQAGNAAELLDFLQHWQATA